MFLLEIIAAFYTFLNQEPRKQLDLWRHVILLDDILTSSVSPLGLIAFYILPDLDPSTLFELSTSS
jgi:hypothetical protein